jgi:tetratricopeptide (TPR) repeat protein
LPDDQVQYWGKRAVQEAQKALRMNPFLAEAHEAMAAVYRKTDFQWELTIQESDQALKLNNSLYLPHYYKAAAFYHMGLFDRAAKEVLEAMKVNVSDRVEALRTQAIIDFFEGRFQQTIQKLREVESLTGKPIADWYLAQAYYYAGDVNQAETVLRGLMTTDYAGTATRAKASMAAILANKHQREESNVLLQDALASSLIDHHALYSIGVSYTQLGNSEKGVEYLRRATKEGFPCYPWFVRDRLLDPLRGTKSFQELISSLQTDFHRWQQKYS